MKSHFYVVENSHTVEECSAIRNAIKNNINSKAVDSPAQGVTKTSKVEVVDYGMVSRELYKFRQIIQDINKNFFGLNLFSACDFDIVNYADYHAQDDAEYGWHADNVGGEMYDIKLTALLNLSENDYEGGKFELFLNGPYSIDKFDKIGSMIVFPSFVPHRVTPVTKGTRSSLAYFVTGPNWL